MIVHFDVSREKSIKATEAAMLQDQNIFLIAQRDAEAEEPQQDQLYRIGIIAVIKQIIKLPNNILRVLVEGIERAELSYLETDGEYLKAEVIRGIWRSDYCEGVDLNCYLYRECLAFAKICVFYGDQDTAEKYRGNRGRA